MTVTFKLDHLFGIENIHLLSDIQHYVGLLLFTDPHIDPRKSPDYVGFGTGFYQIIGRLHLKSIHRMIQARGYKYHLCFGRKLFYDTRRFHTALVSKVDILKNKRIESAAFNTLYKLCSLIEPYHLKLVAYIHQGKPDLFRIGFCVVTYRYQHTDPPAHCSFTITSQIETKYKNMHQLTCSVHEIFGS